MAELRGADSRLLDELFRHAWILLDDAARRVLISLPLFPASAAADALIYCADLSSGAFIRSAEQLVGLSLLDIERSDLATAPRYNAHPLVRTYARARFAELSHTEQSRLYERWMVWCSDTALAVGFCWQQLDLLDTLDHEYDTVQAAIRWASEHHRYRDVITMVEGVRYYYNVRGLWGDDELHNHERRAIAAHQLGDTINEILALAHYIEVLSKQGRVVEAATVSDRLVMIGEDFYRNHLLSRSGVDGGASDDSVLSHDRDAAAFEYGHALALFALAQHDLVSAETHWQQLLRLSQVLGGQKYVVNLRWLAIALLQQGKIAPARELFSASLEEAQRINDVRSVVGNLLKLAAIDLQLGNIASISDALAQCRDMALRYRDRRRLAECHWITARLALLCGDNDSALSEFRLAFDLYERLGMKSMAINAQAIIETLD
jgi:tetratricopeptide (TPR) repeat protein